MRLRYRLYSAFNVVVFMSLFLLDVAPNNPLLLYVAFVAMNYLPILYIGLSQNHISYCRVLEIFYLRLLK